MTSPVVSSEERTARMLFSALCEPGDVDACTLVREHGAAVVLDRLRGRALAEGKLESWSLRMASTSIDEVRAAAEAVSARYVCPGDDEWPSRLDELRRLESESSPRRAGAPFGLWIRGTQRLNRVDQAVAIVGARASSAYGDHVAGDLAYHCGARGWVVVSGGAYGIDAAAHRGALAGDHPTIAVLAGGIDRLYPAGNSSLLRAIERNGLLVAEAAPGCKPIKSRFLTRNRLIAALGSGLVVVEAAIRSGALSSARWALDLDRPVMGVPGPVTSGASSGVHELLRQTAAVLVTDVDEVLEHASPMGRNLAPAKVEPSRPIDRLDGVQQAVLEALPVFTAATPLQISAAAGVAPAETQVVLRELLDLGLAVSEVAGWRLRLDR